jgi:hypothetical protein
VCGPTVDGGSFFGVTLSADRDPWIARLTAEGGTIWAKTIATSGADDRCAVSAFSDGAVAIAGSYAGTVDVGDTTLTSASSLQEFFLARLAAENGVDVWSMTKGGSGVSAAQDIVVHDGSVVVAGSFDGSMDFGGSTTLNAEGTDVFVARYEGSSGGHIYSLRIGGPVLDEALHLSRRAGEIAVAGHYRGTTVFGNTTLVGGNEGDIFVAAVDDTGAVVDVKSLGGPNAETVHTVVSTSELLVVGGHFLESITILGQMLSSGGAMDPDAFLVRFRR